MVGKAICGDAQVLERLTGKEGESERVMQVCACLRRELLVDSHW